MHVGAKPVEPLEQGSMQRDIVQMLALSPRLVFGLVLLASLLCRIIWLPVPDKALIFDEIYYVNSVRVLLHEPVPAGAPYHGAHPGLDPNREHPPLGKVLMAGAMRVLGNNAYGWRFVSIVAGMAAIALLYAVVSAAGGDPWLATTAAALFAFDNLVLVHSRIGTLDMPLVAFLLLASWCMLRRWPFFAGLACAGAALTKVGGVYGLVGLLLFWVLIVLQERRHGLVTRTSLYAGPLLIAGMIPAWVGGFGFWTPTSAPFTPHGTMSALCFTTVYHFHGRVAPPTTRATPGSGLSTRFRFHTCVWTKSSS